MTGWPLSPELLAALQNADPKTLRRAQVALMNALDIEMVPSAPIQETKREVAPVPVVIDLEMHRRKR